MLKAVASRMFLFDCQRTARMRFSKGDMKFPKMVWKTRLPNIPPKCPESSAVFDSKGNLYFGCHDGAFYSLEPQGGIRWVSLTGTKIYSSPSIYEDRLVIVASGNGDLLCYDRNGQVQWRNHLSEYFQNIDSRLKRKFEMLYTSYYAYDWARKKRWDAKCWASPCITDNGIVLITALGWGLHAFKVDDGELVWNYDLGTPRHHLSGVALDAQSNIYLASQRHRFHKLTSEGRVVWTYKHSSRGDAWGNPSIDLEHNTVYFTLADSRKRKGGVCALSLDGRLKWSRKLEDEVRGSVAISYEDYVLVVGFNGSLYFLDKHSGGINRSIKLSSAVRALWTTPSIDPLGNIFITTKDSGIAGSLFCLDKFGNELWRYKTGKALSTPVIDQNSRLFFGSWDGDYLCLQT
jgi:outer membrane protein assembly factor BamB